MCHGFSVEEKISDCSSKEEDSYPEFIFWSVTETEPSKSLIPAALALWVGVDDIPRDGYQIICYFHPTPRFEAQSNPPFSPQPLRMTPSYSN